MAQYKIPQPKPLIVTDALEDLNRQIQELQRDFTVKEIDLVFKEERMIFNQIKTSNEAYEFLKEIIGDGIDIQEHFVVLYLNQANKVIGYYKHTKGTINSTQVDVEMIVAVALKTLAKAVVLCHNHPSGHAIPSEADKKITSKVKAAFEYFDLSVLDHIIITREAYYSFADHAEPALGGLGTPWTFIAREVFSSMFEKLLEYAGKRKATKQAGLSGDAGLEKELRKEILLQLKKVTRANSPNIWNEIQSANGYSRIENLIVRRMITQRLVPAAVIPQLESELSMQ